MPIDVLCFLAIIAGFYLGFKKSILKQIGLIILIVFSVILSILICPYITNIVGSNYKIDGDKLFALGLIVSFLLSVITVKILQTYLEKMCDKPTNGMATRLTTGFIISMLFLMIIGLAVNYLEKNNKLESGLKKESTIYKPLIRIGKIGKTGTMTLKKSVQDFSNFVVDELRTNWKKAKHPKKSKFKIN